MLAFSRAVYQWHGVRGEIRFVGVSYTGSTLALGASRPSSILGTPTK